MCPEGHTIASPVVQAQGVTISTAASVRALCVLTDLSTSVSAQSTLINILQQRDTITIIT